MSKRKRIIQFDLNFKYINNYESTKEASKKTQINQGSISSCCQFWSMNCNKEKWKQERKDNPRTQAGGYIWRFMSDFEDRD